MEVGGGGGVVDLGLLGWGGVPPGWSDMSGGKINLKITNSALYFPPINSGPWAALSAAIFFIPRPHSWEGGGGEEREMVKLW
jgi:hypothetical protein